MKKSRFTEDRIIGVLKEHQAGIPTDVAAKADHFKQTLPGERPLSEYSWQHASGWDGGGGRTAAYRLVILRTGQSVVGPKHDIRGGSGEGASWRYPVIDEGCPKRAWNLAA